MTDPENLGAKPVKTGAPGRNCPRCGGEMRFSHREYGGKAQSRHLYRCRQCGNTVAVLRPTADEETRRPQSKKPPVNQGPPLNPVIDPELAKKLRQQM